MKELDPIQSARRLYFELGFDTLPILPKSKKPCGFAWQKRLPYRLWQNVPQGVNIGIRGGGLANVAFIDCDEYQTFTNVTDYLGGLGIENGTYPVVQTASGYGRHIYLSVNCLLAGNARNLSNDIGKGEFRYGPGAMVVAPPSSTPDGSYLLISGDYAVRPALEAKDLLPILGNGEIVDKQKPALSRKALALLHGKEELIATYSSRSEAEQSLIASMVNVGLMFGDVLDFFNRFPCAGKYAELRTKSNKNAERWLLHSYNEAVQWTSAKDSRARQIARAALYWAESRAWKGRTGAIDQLIFIAHATIAYRAGRLSYAASCRELAELAGIGKTTATRATWRLCKSDLLVPLKPAVGDLANTFHLGSLDFVGHSPSSSPVRKCPTKSNHDAFRHSGLGKSASQIWRVLQDRPANIDELASITGRHIKTIERTLRRMMEIADPLTGELLPMVECDNKGTYYPLPIELDQIAYALGTAGTGARQRKEHARERSRRAHFFENNRQNQLDASKSEPLEKLPADF